MPDQQAIAAAEQEARQAYMDGRAVPQSAIDVLFGTNDSGQIVRNSDGYVSPYGMDDVQDPAAQQYYEQNPQELWALGALGGSGGQFQNASVRGTNLKYGQLTPDQWHKGYTSSFPDGWSGGGQAQPQGASGSVGSGGAPGAVQASAGTSGGSIRTVAGAGPGTDAASAAGLSTNQQALLKALLDQQEIDGITGEARDNASELYDRTQNYERDALGDIATYTGGNAGIYNRYQGDIEKDVGTAVSDARAGQTQALNTAARQAMRYGTSVPTSVAGVSSTQASQLASAANTTRNSSINNYRNLVGQGIGLKDGAFKTSQAGTSDAMSRAEGASMTGRNLRLQDEASDWAKQLDVTGMARGLPGASAGAYSASINAGNSAVSNKMAPGQALVGAMGQSNNTVMQGQQTAMQGTLGVLNAQGQYANTVAQSSGSGLGGLGSLLGGAASAWTAFSDRRLKENIEAVGVDPATGLTIYEFEYIGGSGQRFQGVMADEAEKVMPDAVTEAPNGFKTVNYQMLGIEMKEVA